MVSSHSLTLSLIFSARAVSIQHVSVWVVVIAQMLALPVWYVNRFVSLVLLCLESMPKLRSFHIRSNHALKSCFALVSTSFQLCCITLAFKQALNTFYVQCFDLSFLLFDLASFVRFSFFCEICRFSGNPMNQSTTAAFDYFSTSFASKVRVSDGNTFYLRIRLLLFLFRV
jgi:hypothetical protein